MLIYNCGTFDPDTLVLVRLSLTGSTIHAHRQAAWGHTPCCKQYCHKRCLAKWLHSPDKEVMAPNEDDSRQRAALIV